MTTTTTGGPQVTVLGLGDMGSAIARTFVDRGYRTTVWNRTASKSVPLADAGATVAATAAEAVAASPLVVVCLLDSTAVDEVLGSVDAAVAGTVLVNVTSGSPRQARANERWASERGAEYRWQDHGRSAVRGHAERHVPVQRFLQRVRCP